MTVITRHRFARIPVGKHGTPSWNPGNPTPEQVEKRKTDPLWMYHRGQLGYDGSNPNRFGTPSPYMPVHPDQHHQHTKKATHQPPEGMSVFPPDLVHRSEVLGHPVEGDPVDQDKNMRSPAEHLTGRPYWGEEPLSLSNPRAAVFNFHGNGPGRPMHQGIFPLQELEQYAAKGDPYRIWSASILGGNRHAIPHLVALLRERDNPAGWWGGWSDLHRRMEREQGDLTLGQVSSRLAKIAKATETESNDPAGHRELFENANYTPFGGPTPSGGFVDYTDWSPYLHLADHMEEHGLPHYAALVRSELANVLPEMRVKPKGNRRFRRRYGARQMDFDFRDEASVPRRPKKTQQASPSLVSGFNQMVVGAYAKRFGEGHPTTEASKKVDHYQKAVRAVGGDESLAQDVLNHYVTEILPRVGERSQLTFGVDPPRLETYTIKTAKNLGKMLRAGQTTSEWNRTMKQVRKTRPPEYFREGLLKRVKDAGPVGIGLRDAIRGISAPGETGRNLISQLRDSGHIRVHEYTTVKHTPAARLYHGDIPEHELQLPAGKPKQMRRRYAMAELTHHTIPVPQTDQWRPRPDSVEKVDKDLVFHVQKPGIRLPKQPRVRSRIENGRLVSPPPIDAEHSNNMKVMGFDQHFPVGNPLRMPVQSTSAWTERMRNLEVMPLQSEHSPVSEETQSAAEPVVENPAVSNPKRVSVGRRPRATLLPKKIPAAKTPLAIKKLEQSLAGVVGTDYTPEQHQMWRALASGYAKSGSDREAAIAKDHADFNDPNPPDGPVTPREQEENTSAKRMWLNAEQRFRETGDSLGLAHDRDRVMDRLRGGLTNHLDVPSFIRSAGSTNQGNMLQRLDSLRNDIHGWLDRQDKAGTYTGTTHKPVGATHQLADMAVAYAKSRLGSHAEGSREADAAHKDLSVRNDPVVSAVAAAFRNRVHQATQGRGHADSPTALPSNQYDFSRLSQVSDILDPSNRLLSAHSSDKYRDMSPERVQQVLDDPASSPEDLNGAAVASQRGNDASVNTAVSKVADRLTNVQSFGASHAKALNTALSLAASRGNREAADALSSKLVDSVSRAANPVDAAMLANAGAETSVKSLVDAKMFDRASHLSRGLYDAVTRGKSPQELLDSEKNVQNKMSLGTSLLNVAQGLIASGDRERGMGVVQSVEPLLLGSGKTNSPVYYAKLATSFIRAVAATRDEPFVDAQLKKLFSGMQALHNSGSEGSRFSSQHYRILEEAIRAVVGEGYDTGEKGRRWADDEEYKIRKRIHSKMAEVFPDYGHETPPSRGSTDPGSVMDRYIQSMSGPRRMSRKRKKRKIKRHTVLADWQTSGSGGGTCRMSRITGEESALLSELRVVDEQILDRVRSHRVIPRNIVELAVSLREQLEELGMDTSVLPLRYRRGPRRYADDAGLLSTRVAGRGELDTPVKESPSIASHVENARITTLRNPRKRASVFVVRMRGKPVGYTTSFDFHEPHVANNREFVLHSTWENGKPIAGRGNVEKMWRRRYAAGEEIPFAEEVPTPKKAPSLLTMATNKKRDSLPIKPLRASIINRPEHPFTGTEDQRSWGDSPWNRAKDGIEAAIREGHAVKAAMRGYKTYDSSTGKYVQAIPIDHPEYGPEAYHRHVEAMAHIIRTHPNVPAVIDYVAQASKAHHIGDETRLGDNRYELDETPPISDLEVVPKGGSALGRLANFDIGSIPKRVGSLFKKKEVPYTGDDYSHEKMVQAASRLLQMVRSKSEFNGKPSPLPVYKNMADRHDAATALLGAQKTDTETKASTSSPTKVIPYPVPSVQSVVEGTAPPPITPTQEATVAATAPAVSPRTKATGTVNPLAPIKVKPGQSKKEKAEREGFLAFMLKKGVPDAEAVDEIGLQYLVPPATAKRMWNAFKKKQSVQKKRRLMRASFAKLIAASRN